MDRWPNFLVGVMLSGAAFPRLTTPARPEGRDALDDRIDHANAVVPMDASLSASGSAAFENVRVRAVDGPA
jgi:hypothetical protein